MTDLEPSAAAPRFAVQVLGPFCVSRDGEDLAPSGWPRRAQTLLKLLVTADQGRRLRAEIVDLLWPEAGPDAAASNMRYVLHALRRDLGGGDPPPIASDREWVSLSSHYAWDVDLHLFETLAGQADGGVDVMEEAMTLYRGEPLVEDRYEDWAMPIREQVERTWRTLALRLSREYRRRGVPRETVRWAERLLERDPLDEEAVQELLPALEATGRRPDAVRRYRELEQRLADELGVAPSDETRALASRLVGPSQERPDAATKGKRPRPMPTGRFLGALPEGPIVARKDELERLAAAAEAVERGSGRFIVLVGEPGVGKTRLTQEAMIRLRERGFVVLTGRCSSRAQTIALHPLAEALSQGHSFSLPIAIPAGEPGAGADLQTWEHSVATLDAESVRVAREMSDVLTGMAREHPVALLVDDLHWADAATLIVLHHMAGSTRSYGVLLVATYREVGLARTHALLQTMRELDREGFVERIQVRRLTEEGTAALVAASVGELDAADDFVEFVHRRTKGNPFYIGKMLRSLGGRYRLVRQIGTGGMGRVFEAVDTLSGDTVAAKIMFARTETEPRALQRFEQEGAVLATLEHPNIVQVRGVFLEERASCIAMELLRGRPLGQVLQAQQVDLTHVKQVAQQVAAALACAHERGIVHRDIKPDNIMVLEDGRVKVTDFGIALLLRPMEAVSTMTSTGMTMGTPLYMAPEQIEGKKVDGRADIYALGCVLYQMVTGRPPFEGDDPLTVAIKHVREAPRAPRDVNPRIPKDWEALILKSLAKDPADRFSSAGAMEKALVGLSDGTERPVWVGSRLGLKHPLSGGIAAGIAATAVALGLFVNRSGPGSTAAAASLGQPVRIWSLPSAAPAPLKQPVALAVDRQGTFFVLDEGANRVVHLSRSGAALGTWGGLGSGNGQLRQPQAIALDVAGNVYVADTGNDRIEKFSPTGQFLHVWGHTGSGLGQFRGPDGIAVDKKGFIYVSDGGTIASTCSIRRAGPWRQAWRASPLCGRT